MGPWQAQGLCLLGVTVAVLINNYWRKRSATPGTHTVTVTREGAAWARRDVIKRGATLDTMAFLITKNENDTLELFTNTHQKAFRNKRYAIATSNGVTVIIDAKNVEEFSQLVLDCEYGNFRFRGPGVPQPGQGSHPGRFKLDLKKLQLLEPDCEDDEDHVPKITGQLIRGDTRAAVVMSTAPLVIAAYNDDIDGVALLKFPDRFVKAYSLAPGSRLLTSNYDVNGEGAATDIVRGSRDNQLYPNFAPLISDFLTSDTARLAERKKEVSEDEWKRAAVQGVAAMKRAQGRYRDGRPVNAATCAY